MPPRATLYTGVGDDGFTRSSTASVLQIDLQPVAYGTLDELSAALGLARTAVKHPCNNDIIVRCNDLYQAMADQRPRQRQRRRPVAAGQPCRLGGSSTILGGRVRLPAPSSSPGMLQRCWTLTPPSVAGPNAMWPNATRRC